MHKFSTSQVNEKFSSVSIWTRWWQKTTWIYLLF